MVDSAHSHTFLALTWCCRARVLAPLLRITSWPAVASLWSAADSALFRQLGTDAARERLRGLCRGRRKGQKGRSLGLQDGTLSQSLLSAL